LYALKAVIKIHQNFWGNRIFFHIGERLDFSFSVFYIHGFSIKILIFFTIYCFFYPSVHKIFIIGVIDSQTKLAYIFFVKYVLNFLT